MSAARVEVVRGGMVESVHEVDVAVAGADAGLVARAGDPERLVFARSAVKPFQAMPLVEDGVAAALGLTDEEVALCCASHSGQPRHVALARSLLEKAGVGEEALACGPHAPFDDEAARALDAAGSAPGRVHNNCSGKHAGMLALARTRGWASDGYHESGHPVQERIAAELSRWSGLGLEQLRRGVDGCGVVTFALPLRGIATAFARLASAAGDGEQGAARIVAAMTSHPFVVAGRDRLCTRLMEIMGGRVLAKVGAEGVYGAALLDRRVGIALKVRDGARRAAETALLGVLDALGALDSAQREALKPWLGPVLRNTRGEAVGELRAVVELDGHRG